MALIALLGLAAAVPGPDSVAVVANGNDAESVALARRYLEARQVPERQLCLLDLPEAETIDLSEYLERFDGPFFACLEDRGVAGRIEAVLLTRGVPLRVTVPTEDGDQRVSLAAALGAGRSEVVATGERLLGLAPGRRVDCGGSACLSAAWSNPYTEGVFAPGWQMERQGVLHRPLLVTMLHARSYHDAARLVASATTAEALGGADGEFLLMNGRDPARGVLDFFYAEVLAGLADRGYADAAREPFDANLTGRTLAAFFTGAAQIGDTIEGNTFLPGAIVDNRPSLGAVPRNFRDTGEESQVSIARWVEVGVAGAHGATDEPLNNCFPNRRLLLDYVDGYTLAEAYFRHMPFVYWRNLVLGDPMTAPYADRPELSIRGLPEVVEGSVEVEVIADPSRRIERVALYVDGVEVADALGGSLQVCLPVPEEAAVQVLAVAQLADDGTRATAARAKGWAARTVEGRAGPSDCSTPDAGVISDTGAPPDAAAVAADAGPTADAGAPREADSGCRAGPGPSEAPWALLACVLAWRRAKKRAS